MLKYKYYAVFSFMMFISFMLVGDPVKDLTDTKKTVTSYQVKVSSIRTAGTEKEKVNIEFKYRYCFDVMLNAKEKNKGKTFLIVNSRVFPITYNISIPGIKTESKKYDTLEEQKKNVIKLADYSVELKKNGKLSVYNKLKVNQDLVAKSIYDLVLKCLFLPHKIAGGNNADNVTMKSTVLENQKKTVENSRCHYLGDPIREFLNMSYKRVNSGDGLVKIEGNDTFVVSNEKFAKTSKELGISLNYDEVNIKKILTASARKDAVFVDQLKLDVDWNVDMDNCPTQRKELVSIKTVN